MFIRSLTSTANASNQLMFLPLNNQQCMTRLILINLYRSEYTQGLRYYLFVVNSDRCVRICNTLNHLSNRECVPNNTKDLNLSVFNMITGINGSKTLTKHIQRM